MSARLEEAIAQAQERSFAWGGARAAGVLAGVTRRNEARRRRARSVQRALVGASIASLFVVALFRSGPSASSGTPRFDPPPSPALEPLASPASAVARGEPLDDGGYARD
ncbi:MAG TPA: hypothetical protein VNO21_20520 [Polyangiaceae bacterium]|nr:hypothetical protein [Polyangiaceae bacterium]